MGAEDLGDFLWVEGQGCVLRLVWNEKPLLLKVSCQPPVLVLPKFLFTLHSRFLDIPHVLKGIAFQMHFIRTGNIHRTWESGEVTDKGTALVF